MVLTLAATLETTGWYQTVLTDAIVDVFGHALPVLTMDFQWVAPIANTTVDLNQFTGTEHWYRHSLVRKVLYTDGVQYVAQHGGAYWLIDEIAFAQFDQKIAVEGFQFWRLAVKTDQTAILTCTDGNDRLIRRKRLTFTDFPLDEISFYFTDNVILLPSEY